MIDIRFFKLDELIISDNCQLGNVNTCIDEIIQENNWEIVSRIVNTDSINVYVK